LGKVLEVSSEDYIVFEESFGEDYRVLRKILDCLVFEEGFREDCLVFEEWFCGFLRRLPGF
jgi:hypothetical protein